MVFSGLSALNNKIWMSLTQQNFSRTIKELRVWIWITFFLVQENLLSLLSKKWLSTTTPTDKGGGAVFELKLPFLDIVPNYTTNWFCILFAQARRDQQQKLAITVRIKNISLIVHHFKSKSFWVFTKCMELS